MKSKYCAEGKQFGSRIKYLLEILMSRDGAELCYLGEICMI
jgi:hypothetical protein